MLYVTWNIPNNFELPQILFKYLLIGKIGNATDTLT